MAYVYQNSMAIAVFLDSTNKKILEDVIQIACRFQGNNDVADLTTIMNFDDICNFAVKVAILGQDEWYNRLWTVQESTLASTIYMVPADEDVVFDGSCMKNCRSLWLRMIQFAHEKLREGLQEEERLSTVRSHILVFATGG